MSLADLTTEELAMFQMIEAGFIGVEHHITLLRAKDSRFAEAEALRIRLDDIFEISEAEGYLDTGDAVDLLIACKNYFKQHGPKESVAVLTLYKHSILEEEFAVQPVARLLTDPSEVREPIMEFTEIQERDKQNQGADGSTDDKTSVAEGDK